MAYENTKYSRTSLSNASDRIKQKSVDPRSSVD